MLLGPVLLLMQPVCQNLNIDKKKCALYCKEIHFYEPVINLFTIDNVLVF